MKKQIDTYEGKPCLHCGCRTRYKTSRGCTNYYCFKNRGAPETPISKYLRGNYDHKAGVK